MNEDEREYFVGKAAWAWCAPTCGHLAMIPELAERFAEILANEVRAAFTAGWNSGYGSGTGEPRTEGSEWADYLKKALRSVGEASKE